MLLDNLKNHKLFRSIAILVIVSFTMTSMPAIEEASALSAWLGFQRVTTLRAIEVKTFEEEGSLLIARSLREKEILKRSGGDVQLLSHGKVLVSERLEKDTLDLIREILKHQIKGVLEVFKKDEPLRYKNITDLFLTNEDIQRTRLSGDSSTDDVVSSALELVILRNPRKVLMLEGEMTEEEKEFYSYASAVVESNPGLFNDFFTKRKTRELLLRVGLPEEKAPAVERPRGVLREEEKPSSHKKLLSVFGLKDIEYSKEVTVIERRRTKDMSVVRVRVPETKDKSKIPEEGLDLLKYVLLSPEVYDITTLDLIYNEKDELIAVFPVTPEDKKFESAHLKSPRYLNLSYYNFNIPEIGEKDAVEKWEAFNARLWKDRNLIESYRKETKNAPKDMVDEFKPPYVYAEVDKVTGKWKTMSLFCQTPRGLDMININISKKKNPRKIQIIIPVFPTVYSPGLHNVLDDPFYAHLSKEFPIRKGSDALVVGPGTGLDAWSVSLRTEGKIHAVGINPLEVANLEVTAQLGGFEVEAIVGDNIIDDDGQARFKNKKFDLVVWNMPECSGGEAREEFKPEPLEVYWDGDLGGKALKHFAKGLPLALKERGWAILWNGSASRSIENMILTTLKKVGFVKRVKGKAGYYTYFVSPRVSQENRAKPEEVKSKKRRNSGSSRTKVALTILGVSLLIMFFVGVAKFAINKTIENQKARRELVGGLDLTRDYVFQDEKEMFTWLGDVPCEVELSMTYRIEENGKRRIIFTDVGDAHSVFSSGSKTNIHTHIPESDIFTRMPSLVDLVGALNEDENIIVLEKGHVIKLTRDGSAPLKPFERILKESDEKVRSFMKENKLKGRTLRFELTSAVLERIIFDKISSWEVFDLGEGTVRASYDNPNAWGYMVRLFGFDIVEFENGDYTGFWDHDKETLKKIEELKERGDEFYEDFEKRADEVIRKKHEELSGRSASRNAGILGPLSALTMLGMVRRSSSSKKNIREEFEEGAMEYGGKGSWCRILEKLSAKIKFNTPPSEYITIEEAWGEFFEANHELIHEGNRLISKDISSGGKVREETIMKLQALARRLHFPEETEEKIRRKAEPFKENVIARSSGRFEDSFTRNLAGIFISPKRKGGELLPQAVKEIFMQTIEVIWLTQPDADNILTTLNRYNGFGVVIQQFIDFDSSGTAMTNLYGHVSIEAVIGDAEFAVKGIHANTAQYLFKKENKKKFDYNPSFLEMPHEFRLKGEEYNSDDNPERIRDIMNLYSKIDGKFSPLSKDQAIELKRVVSELEKEVGVPLDVEWGFLEGQLYITQIRPIIGNFTSPLVEIDSRVDEENKTIAATPIALGHTGKKGLTAPIVVFGPSVRKEDIEAFEKTLTYDYIRLQYDVASSVLNKKTRAKVLVDPIQGSRQAHNVTLITDRIARGEFAYCNGPVLIEGLEGYLEFVPVSEEKDIWISSQDVTYFCDGLKGSFYIEKEAEKSPKRGNIEEMVYSSMKAGVSEEEEAAAVKKPARRDKYNVFIYDHKGHDFPKAKISVEKMDSSRVKWVKGLVELPKDRSPTIREIQNMSSGNWLDSMDFLEEEDFDMDLVLIHVGNRDDLTYIYEVISEVKRINPYALIAVSGMLRDAHLDYMDNEGKIVFLKPTESMEEKVLKMIDEHHGEWRDRQRGLHKKSEYPEKLKVLVANDTRSFLLAMEMQVEKSLGADEYEFHYATSYDEAYEVLSSREIDMVVFDLVMDIEDEKKKSMFAKDLEQVPYVILTSLQEREEIESHLPKSFGRYAMQRLNISDIFSAETEYDEKLKDKFSWFRTRIKASRQKQIEEWERANTKDEVAPDEPGKMKVLIANDDEEYLAALKVRIERNFNVDEYEFYYAKDYDEAYEIIKSNRINSVVFDLNMEYTGKSRFLFGKALEGGPQVLVTSAQVESAIQESMVEYFSTDEKNRLDVIYDVYSTEASMQHENVAEWLIPRLKAYREVTVKELEAEKRMRVMFVDDDKDSREDIATRNYPERLRILYLRDEPIMVASLKHVLARLLDLKKESKNFYTGEDVEIFFAETLDEARAIISNGNIDYLAADWIIGAGTAKDLIEWSRDKGVQYFAVDTASPNYVAAARRHFPDMEIMEFPAACEKDVKKVPELLLAHIKEVRKRQVEEWEKRSADETDSEQKRSPRIPEYPKELKVLWVEDDEKEQRAIMKELDSIFGIFTDVDIEIVSSMKEAVSVSEKMQIDVVVFDLAIGDEKNHDTRDKYLDILKNARHLCAVSIQATDEFAKNALRMMLKEKADAVELIQKTGWRTGANAEDKQEYIREAIRSLNTQRQEQIEQWEEDMAKASACKMVVFDHRGDHGIFIKSLRESMPKVGVKHISYKTDVEILKAYLEELDYDVDVLIAHPDHIEQMGLVMECFEKVRLKRPDAILIFQNGAWGDRVEESPTMRKFEKKHGKIWHIFDGVDMPETYTEIKDHFDRKLFASGRDEKYRAVIFEHPGGHRGWAEDYLAKNEKIAHKHIPSYALIELKKFLESVDYEVDFLLLHVTGLSLMDDVLDIFRKIREKNPEARLIAEHGISIRPAAYKIQEFREKYGDIETLYVDYDMKPFYKKIVQDAEKKWDRRKAGGAEEEAARSPERSTVFIVDSSTSLAKDLAEFLEQNERGKYNIVTMDSVWWLERHLRDKTPDVVITDTHIDNKEEVGRISRLVREKNADAKFILTSKKAAIIPRDVADGKRVLGLIEKPFHFHGVLDALKKAHLKEKGKSTQISSLNSIHPVLWAGLFGLLLFRRFNPVILIILPVMFLSITVHEFAHAWTAQKFGDNTAKKMGRLTLNPLKHIDPLGSIVMPLLLGIGWAKPIPLDIDSMTRKERFLTVLAGPAVNFSIGLVFMALYQLCSNFIDPIPGGFLALISSMNFILAGFNLIPITPFDGSHIMQAAVFSQEEKPVSMKEGLVRGGIAALHAAVMLGSIGLGILMWPSASEALLEISEHLKAAFPGLFALPFVSGQLIPQEGKSDYPSNEEKEGVNPEIPAASRDQPRKKDIDEETSKEPALEKPENKREREALIRKSEKAFHSSIKKLEEAFLAQGVKAKTQPGIAKEDGRRKSLILYADDILENASVLYLEETLKEMFSEWGILNGGKIVVFAREESSAFILNKLIERADKSIDTITILREDLRNAKETESGEIRALLRKARSKGAGKALALIKKKDENFKANSPEDLKELCKKLKLPVVLIGGAANSLYSFSEAMQKALSIVEAADGSMQGINWVKILQPMRKITDDIRIQHEEYTRSLKFLIAA